MEVPQIPSAAPQVPVQPQVPAAQPPTGHGIRVALVALVGIGAAAFWFFKQPVLAPQVTPERQEEQPAATEGDQVACAPLTQTVAVGAQATLRGSGGTGAYGWLAPGSATLVQGGTATVMYSQAGTYDVTVQDSEGRNTTCQVVVVPADTTGTH